MKKDVSCLPFKNTPEFASTYVVGCCLNDWISAFSSFENHCFYTATLIMAVPYVARVFGCN